MFCHVSIKDAISYGLRKLGFDQIKENQRQVVETYLAGRDVLMVSPTGSGFYIAPFVYNYLKHGEQEQCFCSVWCQIYSNVSNSRAGKIHFGYASL